MGRQCASSRSAAAAAAAADALAVLPPVRRRRSSGSSSSTRAPSGEDTLPRSSRFGTPRRATNSPRRSSTRRSPTTASATWHAPARPALSARAGSDAPRPLPPRAGERVQHAVLAPPPEHRPALRGVRPRVRPCRLPGWTNAQWLLRSYQTPERRLRSLEAWPPWPGSGRPKVKDLLRVAPLGTRRPHASTWSPSWRRAAS